MQISPISIFKPIALSIALVATLALGSGQAKADEVTLSGSTTGTVTGVPQLTFVGNMFDGTTALGIGSLSGANRLGTFTLATSAIQLVAGTFDLDITFTQPTGIAGGQFTTYTATIAGSVSPVVDSGGVQVTFLQPVGGTVFTFNNGTTSGTFTLELGNPFIQSGRSADLTAGFTGSQTTIPEPTSMLLLGTGLAGVAGAVRRKLKARNQN